MKEGREEGRNKEPTVLSISTSFYIWKAKDLFTTGHTELHNKTEINNCNLKYLNPMAFILLNLYCYYNFIAKNVGLLLGNTRFGMPKGYPFA